MIFHPTPLPGAYLIEQQRFTDERGFFARTWCQQEFAEQGLDANLVQCSVSFNTLRGTLRGMHYQLPPFAESKVVRCTQGAIYDVMLDLRPTSPTFCQWFGAELSAANGRTLYIPKGFAHGFQTLTDNTEIFYQMSEFYAPASAGGARWDDPHFQITWPTAITVISAKDQAYPDFDPTQVASFQQFVSNNYPKSR
jgi:dTDP-4-dehydrorhamnose 3,5-epimerase